MSFLLGLSLDGDMDVPVTFSFGRFAPSTNLVSQFEPCFFYVLPNYFKSPSSACGYCFRTFTVFFSWCLSINFTRTSEKLSFLSSDGSSCAVGSPIELCAKTELIGVVFRSSWLGLCFDSIETFKRRPSYST